MTRLDHIARALEAADSAVSRARLQVPEGAALDRVVLLQAMEAGVDVQLHFRYPSPGRCLGEVVRVTGALPFGSSWADDLLKQKLASLMGDLRSSRRHDPDYITEFTTDTFGAATPSLLKSAWAILERPEPRVDDVEEVGAPEACQRFARELRLVGASDWRVVLDRNMYARVAVSAASKEVKVRGDSVFSRTALERLLVHEIQTHVVRHRNGSNQRASFVRYPLAPNLKTEEGLAVFNESSAGLLLAADLKRYAARVVAVDAALRGSLADVFRLVRRYVDGRVALETAIRSKRGFADPSEPGAHTKDTVYLAGYRDIRSLVGNGRDSWRLLMSCKQPEDLLPRLEELRHQGYISVVSDSGIAQPRPVPRADLLADLPALPGDG